MNKKVTSRLFFAALLACSFVGCTSSDSKTDDQVQATDSSGAVDQELEKLDGEEAAQAKKDEANPNGDLTADQAMPDESTAGNDPTKSPDVASPSDQSPVPDVPMAPSTDTGMADSTPSSSDVVPDASASTDVKPAITSSLKKAETNPFKRGGELLNAIYVARPKDTYKSIAMMIYGSDEKAKTLKKVNPGISKPKPGDKIYYNSPQRPTDETVVKNYYEDNNIPSQSYVGQNGDNLKKVAKQLLGYDQAWKEIWVTNAIDSKSKLDEGEVIHYWPAAANSAMAAATTTPPAAGTDSAQLPPPPPALGADSAPGSGNAPNAGSPPGFGNDTAQAAPDMPMPPPPAPDNNALANNNMPAPSVPDLPPPPPPTPTMDQASGMSSQALAAKSGAKAGAGAQDNDELMLGLAAVGILVAGGAALIIIRKRRQQKAMANAFNDTQIGAG